MISYLIHALLREYARRRRTRDAMREMRRSGYVAEWHDLLPGNRRRAARWM